MKFSKYGKELIDTATTATKKFCTKYIRTKKYIGNLCHKNAAGIIRDFAGRKIADINTWGKNQQHLYNSKISTTKQVATIYN